MSDAPSSDASRPLSSSDARAFEQWRRNISWVAGIGLTQEERQIRDRDQAKKLDESLLRRCDKLKRSLVETSPSIIFMLKHLGLSGCSVSPQHIQCGACDGTTSGGFNPEKGGILICTSGFSNKKHMEDTIVHELVHMYDHCKFKVDWSNLRHHACSEIRAASLSGDCRWGREINRFFFAFSKQHQVCTRRRAILSVATNPDCPNEAAAEQAVNEVWESCFKDTRPFDEIY